MGRPGRERFAPPDWDSVDIASGVTLLMGARGKKGDYISHILVRDFGAVAGAVEIKDGSDPKITLFYGALIGPGLNSEKRPWIIPLGIRSRVGQWQVNTTAGSACTVYGWFTGGI